MTIFSIILLVIAIIICGLGTWWLLYDMTEQLKNYEDVIKNNIKKDE